WLTWSCFSCRRRHTTWPRDWSSDVCSSDLHTLALTGRPARSTSTTAPSTSLTGMAWGSRAGYRSCCQPSGSRSWRKYPYRYSRPDRKSVVEERAQITVAAVALKWQKDTHEP